MDNTHAILKDGIFAKVENQLIAQSLAILTLKAGGKIEMPLQDLQDAQDKRIYLEWEINNAEKKLIFTAKAETVQPDSTPPADESKS